MGRPTENLLSSWSTERDNNVMCLIQLLAGMGREDLVDLLQAEINKIVCNCSECGSIS